MKKQTIMKLGILIFTILLFTNIANAVEITPSIPTINDDLVCYTEPGCPSGYCDVYWYDLDDVNPIFLETVVSLGDSTLSHTKTGPGKSYRCIVYDSFEDSYTAGSDQVTMDTVGPNKVVITPSNPEATEDLTCTANGGVSGYIDIIWHNGDLGSPKKTETIESGKSSILSAQQTSEGENIYCTAYDAFEDNILLDTDSVKIGGNVGPGKVDIFPEDPKTSDDLTCYAEGAVSGYYDYFWYKNSDFSKVYSNAQAIPSSETVKGQFWTCKAKDAFYDYWINSEGDTVKILNSAPTIAQPKIDQLIAYTDSTLTCTKGAVYDADGDPVTVDFQWLENGNLISGQTGTSLDLKIPGLDKGDSISCRTTPFDGTDYGNSADSNAIIISNTAPNLADLADFSMDEGQVITKDYSGLVSDIDGDALTLANSGNNNIAVSINGFEVTYAANVGFSGSETITFTLSDGTSTDSDTVTVTVNDINYFAPVAGFTFSPSEPKIYQTVSFTDQSTDGDGPNDIVSWEWNFGDGSPISTAKNPQHQYTNTGDFQVTLKVTDKGGLTSTAADIITVAGGLNVDSISCVSDKVMINDIQSCTIKISAENAAIEGAKATVYFTDGTEFGTCITQSTGACVVQNTMTALGTYTIYSHAEKEGFEPDKDKNPDYTFEVWDKRYEIRNLGIYNDAGFTVEDYDFFRGENLYTKFQVYDFFTGQYISGMISQVTMQSPPGGLINLTKEAGSDPSWYYYSLKPIPATHEYKGESQIFYFTFNVPEQTIGQEDVLVMIRNNPPVITGIIDDITLEEGTTISFYYTGTDIEDPNDLAWTVQGSNNALFTVSMNQNELTVNAISKGTGTATITLSDTDKDTDSRIINIEVKAEELFPPVAEFSFAPTTPGINEIITFTDLSTDANGNDDIVSWEWDFDNDGVIDSTVQNPTHGYSVDGTYQVTLTVRDTSGLSDSITKPITVSNEAPVADFSYSPVNPEVDEIITFTDLSTDANGNDDIVSWEWDFDNDGVIDSTVQNPTHSYSLPGIYPVTLTVTDTNGLSDSINRPVTVRSEIEIVSINCLDYVVTGKSQSCSIYVEADGEELAGADVKLYYSDDSYIGSCTTNNLTGGCNIIFTAGVQGSYTVYATAEKADYTPDLDKNPTETFNVLRHRYDIINLQTYNDNTFMTADDDFFRGENLYIKFQVIDLSNSGAIVYDVVTGSTLTSPPGGIADLTEFQDLGDGWYYYALEPIPATHDFLGNSQVFTFAFNFSDNSAGQENISITIRNNPPVISEIPSQSVTMDVSEKLIDLAPYVSDKEDSLSDLSFIVEVANESVVLADINGTSIRVRPQAIGETKIRLVAEDRNGESAETSFNFTVRSGLSPVVVEKSLKEHIQFDRIRMPAHDRAKAGERAVLSFNMHNDGDVDLENIKITATIIDLPFARRTAGPFSLDEGEEVTKQIVIDIPKDAEPGRYTVKITASGGADIRKKHRMLIIE